MRGSPVDGERGVVYVGATGLHPAARAWLHLRDPDPEVGRAAALYPDAAHAPLDVLAQRLPAQVPPCAVKAALIARLAAGGLLSAGYVGAPPRRRPKPIGTGRSPCTPTGSPHTFAPPDAAFAQAPRRTPPRGAAGAARAALSDCGRLRARRSRPPGVRVKAMGRCCRDRRGRRRLERVRCQGVGAPG